jgi:hypothetical protein
MLSKELEKTLHRSLAHANQRRHEYATLEHLLLALTEDADAVGVFRGCGIGLETLYRNLLNYVDIELANLVTAGGGDAKPTASFQRVLQRAAIYVQTSGRDDVTGADVLVAMFAERASHAVYYLQEQGMTRFDAVNYVAHGISKEKEAEPIDTAAGSFIEIKTNKIPASPDLLQIVGNDTRKLQRNLNSASTTSKVFISYAHRDVKFISRLEVHLKPIATAGLIAHWHDGLIKPGTKWRDEIRLAIDSAKFAILLVSADYLASDFIRKNELPPLLKAAEETGCNILSIIASPCRFLRTPALAEFQAINPPTRPLSAMNANQREALFARVAETIENILQVDFD